MDGVMVQGPKYLGMSRLGIRRRAVTYSVYASCASMASTSAATLHCSTDNLDTTCLATVRTNILPLQKDLRETREVRTFHKPKSFIQLFTEFNFNSADVKK